MSKTPVQQAVLVDLLIHGADKAKNIADRTGYHRNSISRGIQPLVKDGLLIEKGSGVYRLSDAGREFAQGYVKSKMFPYEREDES